MLVWNMSNFSPYPHVHKGETNEKNHRHSEAGVASIFSNVGIEPCYGG
jgi:hypothetical protein